MAEPNSVGRDKDRSNRKILCYTGAMSFEFTGEVWFWRGPAPFYFVTVPPEQSRELKDIMTSVTYGWGMILVHAEIGGTQWSTAMFPKDGSYVLPLKLDVRKAEGIDEGDTVAARLEVVNAR